MVWMTDADIKVGDVCHDLIERGKVQIVAKAADTVADYRDREEFDLADYKAHPLLRVPDDDTVWTAVYLPDKPTTTFNGSYDFPESRLARIPVENANEAIQRVQRSLTVTLLTQLLLATEDAQIQASHRVGPGDIADLARVGFAPEDLVSEALELADVERRFGGGDE